MQQTIDEYIGNNMIYEEMVARAHRWWNVRLCMLFNSFISDYINTSFLIRSFEVRHKKIT